MLLKTHSFEFGEYVLDTKEKILLYRGKPVSITPKVYDLLYFLVKNHGHLSEKDAIMDDVWANSFVEDSNLTYTIRQLRKILNDDARNPKFIETIPRRGYRFIADVSVINNQSPKQSEFINNDKTDNKDFATDKVSNIFQPGKYITQRNLLYVFAVGFLVFVCGLAMNSLQSNNDAIPSKRLSFKTLKTNGKSLHSAISPDGKFFAYTDEIDEKVSLWLQNIETSEKREILPASDVFYFGLIFSYDGNSVYFVRRKQTGTNNADIYKVSTLGGIPEKIIEHAEGSISLSPNNKKISYVRADKNRQFALFIADSDGKNERKIVTKKIPEGISQNQFSPDGRSIAYATGQTDDGKNNYRLKKINLENGRETIITKKEFYIIANLAWMPNGTDLLLTARESYGESHKIWKIKSATGEAIKLIDVDRYTRLSLDKKGTQLLVNQTRASFNLSVFSINNPNKRKSLASAITASFLSNNEIAYTTSDKNLWKIGFDGKDLKHLTKSEFINAFPLLSANGNYIYVKSYQNGSNQIWRMDADGSNQIQLTKKVGGIPKFISLDGKELFFESNFHSSIWKVSTKGKGDEKEVWNKRLLQSNFTSDGSKLAYLRHNESEGNRLEIEIVNLADKSILKKITFAEKELRPIRVAWLNDNETILYITGSKLGYKLWKQSIESDTATFIADLGKEIIRSFSVSPNGKNILLVSGEWLDDVILIEGFS